MEGPTPIPGFYALQYCMPKLTPKKARACIRIAEDRPDFLGWAAGADGGVLLFLAIRDLPSNANTLIERSKLLPDGFRIVLLLPTMVDLFDLDRDRLAELGLLAKES